MDDNTKVVVALPDNDLQLMTFGELKALCATPEVKDKYKHAEYMVAADVLRHGSTCRVFVTWERR